MKNKLYITLFILLSMLTFSFSYTFATNNIAAIDGVRNVVGGAENIIENAGNDIVSGVRNITSSSQNTMENATENMNNKITQGMSVDNENYTSSKTSTRMAADSTQTTNFLGMNSTMWTWIIMAIVGIAIIALVWIYGKQNEKSYND